MFYVSEPMTTAPSEYKSELQKRVYAALSELDIGFERVDTDDAITMEDCRHIDEKLDMRTVKTLFLCNRQQSAFYLFITTAEKPFSTKDFSSALGISRVSFASEELLQLKLGVKIGATTVFGVLMDANNEVQVVIDKAVTTEAFYGCSDGTTTCYMKLEMGKVLGDFLDFAGHKMRVIAI